MTEYVRGAPRRFRDAFGSPFLSFDPKNDDPILDSLPRASAVDVWNYPEAYLAIVDDYKKPMLTPGTMPIGAIIHYTVSYSLESTVRCFRESKLGSHLVVGPNGEVVQFYKLNHQAVHAADATWNGKVQLDRYFMGIEVVSLGAVREVTEGCYVDAYNRAFRGTPRDCLMLGNRYWAQVSDAQEEALIRILMWAVQKFRFKVSQVLGHYEICAGKIDPGGVASWGSMENLREILRGLLKNSTDLY